MRGKRLKALLALYRVFASPSFWFWFPQEPKGGLQMIALVVLESFCELVCIVRGLEEGSSPWVFDPRP